MGAPVSGAQGAAVRPLAVAGPALLPSLLMTNWHATGTVVPRSAAIVLWFPHLQPTQRGLPTRAFEASA